MPKSRIESQKSKITPARWAAVRLLALDVDGVLTDGRVLISSDGTEAKFFSILDGLGLRLLEKAGIPVALISGRGSEATTARATELGIPHVIQGRTDKAAALQELARKLGLSAPQCAYMGDDIIDVPAMVWAGIGIAPPGAISDALAAADYVTRREGGHGAVREVCDQLLAAKSKAHGAKRERAGPT
jgi:3-deoxy-D-manno-octulosonate 8-phosphate phosphatase (KDO 8-P phosphatase)